MHADLGEMEDRVKQLKKKKACLRDEKPWPADAFAGL